MSIIELPPPTVMDLDDLPVFTGAPPIPPDVMPSRHVKKRPMYEPAACTECGLMGHKKRGHLKLSKERRLHVLKKHVASIARIGKRMSPHERWWQLAIYPRMITGYKEAVSQGKGVRMEEVNTVLQAFQLMVPDRTLTITPPPVTELKNHRRASSVINDAFVHKSSRKPHSGGFHGTDEARTLEWSDTIPVLQTGNIAYTGTSIQTQINRMDPKFVDKLRDLRHRLGCVSRDHDDDDCGCPGTKSWTADFPDNAIKHICTECGLTGHNAKSCRNLNWETRIIVNATTPALQPLDPNVVAAILRNSFFGLVRLIVTHGTDPTRLYTIQYDRDVRLRDITIDDLIGLYNSIIFDLRDYFKIIDLKDANTAFTTKVVHQPSGTDLADFLQKFYDKTDKRTIQPPPKSWNLVYPDGVHKTTHRDEAIGLVALVRGGMRLNSRQFIDTISCTQDFYMCNENREGLLYFNDAILGVYNIREVTRELWDEASAIVEAHQAIDLSNL